MNAAVDIVRTNETETVQRARAGCRESFARLVQTYQRKVYGLAWSVLRNEAEAEDAAQDAFLRAYRSIGTLRAGCQFGPWISRIAVNVAINAVKGRSRRLKLARSAGRPALQARDGFSEGLENALRELEPRERLALELFYRDSATYVEIAELLETNIGQVKNFMHRGRRKLRKILGNYFGS